ncbi:diguanylate cyclase [Methylobacterium terricola]|uniref:diguanylate cyclase n=1 Tax=Methylobacterium terricola TaxID=2583531 RepID=A0A5C4LAJ1_9HYPH|nr:diguanylate cyclase [Methylobacterium terricola]TNC09839.1 diguanylate cyclase [Methylobacterium terricola]
MSSRTLRTPLLTWVIALAVVTVAAAGFTLATVSALRDEAARPVAADLRLIRALHELGDAMSRVRINAVKAAFSIERSQRDEVDWQSVRSQARVDAAFASIKAILAEGQASTSFMPILEARWQDYAKAQEALVPASLLAPRAQAVPQDEILARLNELVNVVTSNPYGELVATLSAAMRAVEADATERLTATDAILGRVVPVQAATAVGVLALCLGLGLFLVGRVTTPLAKVAASLERMAVGDATEPDGLTDDRREFGRIAAHLERLRTNMRLGQKTEAERRTLSQTSDWLQSAKSEEELYSMVSTVLSRLIPECRGALYVYSGSRDTLDLAESWNDATGPETIHPDDCWGLRRGRLYVHGANPVEFRCGHVHEPDAQHYCCLPILAHGETIGLLHLAHGSAGPCDATAFAESRRLGMLAAEHIALAIANMKLREQLLDQSIRDVLTGLYNRRYLLERGRSEFLRAQRLGAPVSLLSIDVDHFKAFNDNFGHDAGDTVLRAVSEVLQRGATPTGVACRFGGEEFLILLPGTAAPEAMAQAEVIRREVETLTIRYAESDLPRISVSVGVAAYPVSGQTLQEVMRVADATLYEAKRGGRNRVVLSEDPLAAREEAQAG